jgi:glycosyltransferase involved in cell wall biosynthesis
VIAGQGPDRARFEALARELGVADRVRFAGAVPQPELRSWYNAADVMVLASEREGWANVLLESMACGTPMVATSICGTPEVVTAPEAGRLMPERTPESLAEAVRLLRAADPDRGATRRYAERFSWDDTTRGQIDLFSHIIMGKS